MHRRLRFAWLDFTTCNAKSTDCENFAQPIESINIVDAQPTGSEAEAEAIRRCQHQDVPGLVPTGWHREQ